MAYDEILAQRIQQIMEDQPGLVGKKMFGGVGYMLNGNMACGVHKEFLIVRVGPDNNDQALAQPHTRPFDITGRPMAGWVMIAPEGCKSDTALEAWVKLGVDFALTLPSK